MESETASRRAEEIASAFIAQRETGPWSAQDAAQLKDWLARATLHQVVYCRMNAIWQEAGRLKVLHGSEMSKPPGLASSLRETDIKQARRMWWMSPALAAGLVALTVATLLTFRESIFWLDRYSTRIGGLEAIQIADGSRVMLNTDSSLRVRLTEQERRVELDKGEAFFDVAKDPARPFVVAAGDKRIVAVGTRFSVRRTRADLQVSVLEGAVRVDSVRANELKGVLLPAGTMARANNESVAVQEQPITEIEKRLTWRSGVLTFHRTPLSDAVEEINRYNQRKIVVRDPAIGAIRVGGTFEATKIDSFLRLLESGFSIAIEREGDQVVLASK